MDIITIARAVVRRWYVSFPLVVATILVLALLWANLPTLHQQSTTVLVVGPEQNVVGTDVVEVNPLLQQDDSVKVAAVAGADVMDSQRTRDQLFDEGVDSDYIVEVQPATSFVDIAVTDSDETEAARSIDVILDRYESVISDLQSDSPAEQRLSVQRIRDPDVSAINPENSERLLAMVFVLGLLAAIGSAVLADVILGRRRSETAWDEPTAAGNYEQTWENPIVTSNTDLTPDAIPLHALRAGDPRAQSPRQGVPPNGPRVPPNGPRVARNVTVGSRQQPGRPPDERRR